MPPLSYLTSCTPIKSSLYLANSLATAVSEPALYRLLTFHVPKKMFLFCCLLRDTSSRNTPHPGDPSGGVKFTSRLFCLQRKHLTLWVFLNMGFHGEALLAPRPTPQVGGPHLVGCPRLLIQFICSYPPYRRPFFHPQSEDTPCRGDRDPLITWKNND